MTVAVEITQECFCPYERLGRFDLPSGVAGATASFIGRCRRQALTGAVTALELQHYAGFTERMIQDRASAIASERSLIDFMVIHRVGLVAPGEAIVLAATRALGREAAIAAVEEMMDFLKTDAPFWKRQHYQSASPEWIEPSERDQQRRKRWD